MDTSRNMADVESKEAVFNCSVCETPKKFQHPLWKTRKGADTFCNVCRKVTYHENNHIAPADSSAAPVIDAGVAADLSPSHPTAPAPVPTPVSQPISAVLPLTQPAQPTLQPVVPGPGKVATIPINELWNDFVLRLTAKGSKPEDLGGATTSTIHDVLRDLGYDALNSARLQTELHYRIPRKPVAPVAQPAVPQPSVIPSNGDPASPVGQPPLESAPSQPGAPSTDLGADIAPATTADQTAPDVNTQAVLPVVQMPAPPELANAETSVSGLDEDSLLRQTQKTMEDELKKMDEELEKLKKEAARQTKESEKPKESNAKSQAEKDAKETVPDISVPYPEITSRVPQDLWPVLIERLAACGLSEADVAASTALTFEKVLLYLAFNPLERARLLQEFTAKYGANVKNTGPAPPAEEKPPQKPPVAFDLPDEVEHEPTPLEITGPPTGATVPYAGEIVYETGTNLRNEPELIDPSMLHRYPNWKGPGWESHASAQPPSESDFFNEDGLLPIVKCSSHPEREIEFWCVSCEALVCSLCHITGYHKDHPFVPLSEAAKKECPGLADWQMRAAAASAKLQDTRASLDGVHQNIDDYHQQQIDNAVDTIDQIRAQLETHKDNLVKRIQGHAAAQHQLFHGAEDRIKSVRNDIQSTVNKMDVLLCTKPDSMTPEDARRWAQGVMKIRSAVGSTFADIANHPVVIPNYSNLKFSNEVVPDDLYGKAFLSKLPTPVGMPSYIDMRELSHPLFASRDRLNFSWAPPDPAIDYDGNGGKNPLALNNNNLTCTYAGTGSGHVMAKGTATFEAGRHYWEVRIDAMHNDNRLGTHVIVGLVAEGATSMGSTTGLAWCVDKLSGMVPMSLECPPWTPGSLLGIFLDLEMDRVGLYFNKQCIAHVAIPHGRYTPAASIHCFHDQITLIPVADIPTGVSLTSGLVTQNNAYRLPIPNSGSNPAKGLIPADNLLDPVGNTEITYLQDECLKLRQSVGEAKREIVEQQRVQAQRNFQEQQVKDLKTRIDETAALMARQALEFETTAADDLRKLQEFQKNQLEDETKRAWQMQQETAKRAREVAASHERQQHQASKLERFLREQQVQITQQMLDRQKQQEDDAAKQQQEQLNQHSIQQKLLKQHLMQQMPSRTTSMSRASPLRARSGPSPVPLMPQHPIQAAPLRQPSPIQHVNRISPSRNRISPSRARTTSAQDKDSTSALRDFIDMAGRLT